VEVVCETESSEEITPRSITN
jgi:hypothetical protein